MGDANTTAAVQQFLKELVGLPQDSQADAIVRALLGRAVGRLQLLCANFLHRSYPRLARAPLNLQSEELLSAVVERLLKALEKTRPPTVRQFFAMANQHIRWELNDVARRLDRRGTDEELVEGLAFAPASSDSEISINARRMLDAIENLPDDEKEVFSLVRIQGMAQAEVAEVMEISVKTVQRRLNRSLLLLARSLGDLQPPEELHRKERHGEP